MWSRRFRVELIPAKALPLHLLHSLVAVASSSDPLKLRAATSHLRQLADHLDFIRSIDYAVITAEASHLLGLFKNRKTEHNSLEGDTFFDLGWKIQSFEDTCGLVNDSFFSLVAIGFLASDLSREEIVHRLKGQSWATKHEILTRWGWMVKHRELLEKDNALPAPYSCAVAFRGKDGRNADREFSQLLSFLHFLRFQTGKELLYHSKLETPDFILEDEEGCLVGAEMTEASISDQWDKEEEASDKVLRCIHAQLQYHFVYIHVRQPTSWIPLAERTSEIEEWLLRELPSINTPNDEVSLVNNELDLVIELTRSEETPSCIATSGLAPQTYSEIQERSREMLETLRERIENKIVSRKTGQLKKVPAIRPCHLVIYPNHDLGVDLDSTIERFFQQPPIKVKTHFDHIWISSETRLIPLD
jgi:hypothetical protein